MSDEVFPASLRALALRKDFEGGDAERPRNGVPGSIELTMRDEMRNKTSCATSSAACVSRRPRSA